MMKPSTNRNAAGRFLPGNPGGPGNPHAGKVGKLRTALIEAVTEQDIKEVVASLVKAAKSGDIPAAKLLFDRVIGKCSVLDEPADKQATDEARNRVLSMLSIAKRIKNDRQTAAEH
jgi:hypothetical protein